MPKDYKDAPPARAESRLSHPMLLGIIIGLLMGIVISLAVALWLNRLSNPFVDRGRPAADAGGSKLLPGQVPAQDPRAAEKPKAGGDKAKPGDRPRFEFYQILPGEKEADKAPPKQAAAPAQAPAAAAKPAEAKPAPPAPAPAAKPAEAKPAPQAAAPAPGPNPPTVASTAPTAPRPGSSPASPKPHSGDVYWLQAGAFSEEKEADNLRARIALTGLEAAVRPVRIPDKGTLYRVRLGPYQSLDDANRMKNVLSQNGVGAAIIRTTDEPKTP